MSDEGSNPVDQYFADQQKQAADRHAEDVAAWQAWKKSPSKQNTSALLNRFNSDFNQKVKQYKAGPVDEAAFRADLKKNALTAFESYDPSRGTTLKTHVNNLLRRSQRFNARYQNIAFIPEEKAALITPINRAKDILHEEYGEDPTHHQIADYLNENPEGLPKRVQGKVTPKLISTVQSYQIKDIPGRAFTSEPEKRPVSFEHETFALLRTALKTEDEKTVYDYLSGSSGKPKVESTGEIARRMGKSPSQVSRIRRKIEQLYKQYI